jgi:hypothetical protein
MDHRYRVRATFQATLFTLASVTAGMRRAWADIAPLPQGYNGAYGGTDASISLPPFVWGPLLLLSMGCALWLLSLVLIERRVRRTQRGMAPSASQRRLRALRRWLAKGGRKPRPGHAVSLTQDLIRTGTRVVQLPRR